MRKVIAYGDGVNNMRTFAELLALKKKGVAKAFAQL